MKPFRSRYTLLERKTNKQKMKQRQRNDIRTAKISWKIDQRITIVSNHNINIRHEIWNLLDQGIPTLKGKQTKKVWSRNKEARPAKPAVPEIQKQQGSNVSYFKQKYDRIVHSILPSEQWWSVQNRILNLDCAEHLGKCNINKVIEFRWSWITIRWVNEFSISVMGMRNNTLRNAGFRSREKYASICAKPSKYGYTSQSQETAELYVQVITSIFQIFERWERHTFRRWKVNWFSF